MGMRTARRLAAAGLALGLLTACGSPEYVAAGPWRPQVDGPPPVVAPPEDTELPLPPAPGEPPPVPEPGQEDPNVVAFGLDTPWGLALLPDGSAIVGERRTGRILQVFPDRSPPVELMTIAGLDSTGDGGLLGLAVSPTFVEDALVYAYATTATDNRLLRFTLGGTPRAIFTGIPKGGTGNGGRIVFGPDELLYVGTGDAGRPELAGDPVSLAGKVLRLDIFGTPAPEDPQGTSPVLSRGHSNVTGLCFDAADRLFLTESLTDEFSLFEPGADYGWRDRPGASDLPTRVFADAGLGGCGIISRVAFLGAVDGERIWTAILDGNGDTVGEPEEFLTATYGRLRTVVADPVGALWITTSNLDGPNPPAPTDDRVLRVPPPADGGGSVS